MSTTEQMPNNRFEPTFGSLRAPTAAQPERYGLRCFICSYVFRTQRKITRSCSPLAASKDVWWHSPIGERASTASGPRESGHQLKVFGNSVPHAQLPYESAIGPEASVACSLDWIG